MEQELLTRLVALNHERAAEEKRGLVRWLRPAYQRGGDHRSPSPPEASIQQDLAGTETPPPHRPGSHRQVACWTDHNLLAPIGLTIPLVIGISLFNGG